MESETKDNTRTPDRRPGDPGYVGPKACVQCGGSPGEQGATSIGHHRCVYCNRTWDYARRITLEDRQVLALERIATALERIADSQRDLTGSVQLALPHIIVELGRIAIYQKRTSVVEKL